MKDTYPYQPVKGEGTFCVFRRPPPIVVELRPRDPIRRQETELPAHDAERLEKFLAPPRIATLATVGPAGAPQVTPVWYAYEQGRLVVAAAESSAKVRNLRRDPRLSVCVYAGERGERYAAIYGNAEVFGGDGVWPQVRRIVERYQQPDTIEDYMAELMTQTFAIITLEPQRVLFGP